MIEEYFWYCPNGCQTYKSSSPEPDNCGACGSYFSSDSQSYDDVLESIEERGIAEAERELLCVK